MIADNQVVNYFDVEHVSGFDEGFCQFNIVVRWHGITRRMVVCQNNMRAVADNRFPKNLGEVISGFETVLVPEMNSGQLVRLIRDKYRINATGISKVKGRPFFVDELKRKIKESIA